ncbi:hypothetical protein [Dendronalium sp. ChiSLP03b]|uniref:hypothetical protein n=1 Tax=Dendronalium sp. ChiSLP03b TaxID=3075381 RepID=UPI002AD29214|nr:hypothetical protein [Dendronalium sp. ChiSLP03b]MDZ8202833.1 hypothetical protein [Dendronalium sp. ChiSLP03b]
MQIAAMLDFCISVLRCTHDSTRWQLLQLLYIIAVGSILSIRFVLFAIVQPTSILSLMLANI